MHDLILDTQIRNWVLLPIVFILFLYGILRNNIGIFLRSERPSPLSAIRDRQLLIRSNRLRSNASFLPPQASSTRQVHFLSTFSNLISTAPPSQDAMAANPLLADPSNITEMMKGNVSMVVPQLLMMAWISYFFSGFILVKLPFPLTLQFRGMLQRGVETLSGSLDVTYVSALSWYFLTLFGLQGITNLLLGEGTVDEGRMMQQQMNMQMGMMGGGMAGAPDMRKMWSLEKENLELLAVKWNLKDAEKRLVYGKKVKKVKASSK